MKKEDVVKIGWEQKRDSAIEFGKLMLKRMMENYQEPTRAGTPKGDPIGFSRKKKWAALWMILYNRDSGLGLKEIAKIAGVPPGVLRVWRTEGAFKKEEGEACKKVGELIRDSIDTKLIGEEIESIKKKREADGPDKLSLLLSEKQTIFKILKSERENPTPFIKKFLVEEAKKRRIRIIEIDDSDKTFVTRPHIEIKNDDELYAWAACLVCFDPLVSQPLVRILRSRIDAAIGGYIGIASILSAACHVRDEKSRRQWNARPEIKDLTKSMIEAWIELISSPEARKDLGPKTIEETAEKLKRFIFQQLDL